MTANRSAFVHALTRRSGLISSLYLGAGGVFHLLRARTRPTLAFRGVHLWGQYIMLKRASVRLAGGVIRVVWEDDKDADVTSVDFGDTYFPA